MSLNKIWLFLVSVFQKFFKQETESAQNSLMFSKEEIFSDLDLKFNQIMDSMLNFKPDEELLEKIGIIINSHSTPLEALSNIKHNHVENNWGKDFRQAINMYWEDLSGLTPSERLDFYLFVGIKLDALAANEAAMTAKLAVLATYHSAKQRSMKEEEQKEEETETNNTTPWGRSAGDA
jgi:hypothetical protein